MNTSLGSSGNFLTDSDQKIKKACKEIYTLEFQKGDIARRFAMIMPANPGKLLRILAAIKCQ